MFCLKCGREIEPGMAFCPECGAPAPSAGAAQTGVPAGAQAGMPQGAPGSGQTGGIPGAMSPIPPDRPAGKNKGPVIALIVLLALLVAAGIGAAVWFLAGDKTERLLDKADAALKDKEYEDALDAYEEVLKREDDNVDAYLGSAEAYLAQDEYEKAVDILADGMKANKKDEDALGDLAKQLVTVCQDGADYYMDEEDEEAARKLLESGMDELERYGLDKELGKLEDTLQELNGWGGSFDRGESATAWEDDDWEDWDDGSLGDAIDEWDDADAWGEDVWAQGGYGEGYEGDVIHTEWFDFTVLGGLLLDPADSISADGQTLLVAVTVENTCDDVLTMYDTDFQIQWGDDAEDAYGWPIEDADEVDPAFLPGEYTLRAGESVTGLLLYEVPFGSTDFSLSYQEYYNDGSMGDVFFVYFNALVDR